MALERSLNDLKMILEALKFKNTFCSNPSLPASLLGPPPGGPIPETCLDGGSRAAGVRTALLFEPPKLLCLGSGGGLRRAQDVFNEPNKCDYVISKIHNDFYGKGDPS